MWNFLDGVTDGLIAGTGDYWDWGTVLRLVVVAVCLYGGYQALQPDLTMGQRAFRFGLPVLLLAIAFLMPMGKKRT